MRAGLAVASNLLDEIIDVVANKKEGEGRCISVITPWQLPTLQLDSIVYSHYGTLCIYTLYCKPVRVI
jgi:hypothetical protein